MGPTTARITLTDELFDEVAERFFDAIDYLLALQDANRSQRLG